MMDQRNYFLQNLGIGEIWQCRSNSTSSAQTQEQAIPAIGLRQAELWVISASAGSPSKPESNRGSSSESNNEAEKLVANMLASMSLAHAIRVIRTALPLAEAEFEQACARAVLFYGNWEENALKEAKERFMEQCNAHQIFHTDIGSIETMIERPMLKRQVWEKLCNLRAALSINPVPNR